MSSGIIAVATAIAEEFADYNSEVITVPEFHLPHLATQKFFVVPMGEEITKTTRGSLTTTYEIEIGITQKSTTKQLFGHIAFVENIAKTVLYKRFAESICVSAVFDPLYSVEDMREKNQFISVLSLTLKSYE